MSDCHVGALPSILDRYHDTTTLSRKGETDDTRVRRVGGAFPRGIRCRNDQSLAATFWTFPKWLYISRDARDMAAGVPLSDMCASDCEELLQVIVQCARQMSRELPHQNTRRRRMTALLQECFRVQQYQRFLAQNQSKPFQTLAMRYHDFLAYIDSRKNLWEPATIFFTSATRTAPPRPFHFSERSEHDDTCGD